MQRSLGIQIANYYQVSACVLYVVCLFLEREKKRKDKITETAVVFRPRYR
jgi:hypothetical protein